jgi:SAM-dependent methyltransferase
MLESLGSLYQEGANVDWVGFDRDYQRRIVKAPTYPFQRRRYWGVGPQLQAVASSSIREEILKAGVRESSRTPIDVDVRSYSEKWAKLERLTAARVYSALNNLGVFASRNASHSVESIMRACGAAEFHRPLIGRWLKLLETNSYLCREGERFVVRRGSPKPLDKLACRAELETILRDDPWLLAYLQNCFDKLETVISGKESPLETLFPNGSPDLAENLYGNANPTRYIGGIAASIVDAAVRSYSPDRPIRVVEIGAGTGGTTAALLPALPAHRSSYLFTDVSEYFWERAVERFSPYHFLRFGRLNIEKALEEQGYDTGTFDIVVAANVLHATQDVGVAIKQARKLLAPGGLLLLIESTRHLSWMDISTGLIEGWQSFKDDMRMDSPLLPPEMWVSLLSANGFENTSFFPPPDTPGEVFGQHIFVAYAPGNSSGPKSREASVEGASSAGMGNSSEEEPSSILCELRSLSPDERRERLAEFVGERARKVLHRDSSMPLALRDRLMDSGMDSLIAVQFRNLLRADFQIQDAIPAVLIFDYPTIESIAEFLDAQLFPSIETQHKTHNAPAIDRVRQEQVEQMTDDEVEALLELRLNAGLGEGHD